MWLCLLLWLIGQKAALAGDGEFMIVQIIEDEVAAREKKGDSASPKSSVADSVPVTLSG